MLTSDLDTPALLVDLWGTGEAGSTAGAFGEIDPRKLQAIGKALKLCASKYFVSIPDQLIEIIESYQKARATHIDIVTNSFPEKIAFVGERVLPYFVSKS